MAEWGELPSVRGAGQYLIEPAVIDAWLEEQRHRPGSMRLVLRKDPGPRGRDDLAALTAAGWTDQEIADALACRAELVSKWRTNGVVPLYRRPLRETADRIGSVP